MTASLLLSCICLLPVDISALKTDLGLDKSEPVVYNPKMVLLLHTEEKINPAAFIWGIKIKKPGIMISKDEITTGDIVSEVTEDDKNYYVVTYQAVKPVVSSRSWPRPVPNLDTMVIFKVKK